MFICNNKVLISLELLPHNLVLKDDKEKGLFILRNYMTFTFKNKKRQKNIIFNISFLLEVHVVNSHYFY